MSYKNFRFENPDCLGTISIDDLISAMMGEANYADSDEPQMRAIAYAKTWETTGDFAKILAAAINIIVASDSDEIRLLCSEIIDDYVCLHGSTRVDFVKDITKQMPSDSDMSKFVILAERLQCEELLKQFLEGSDDSVREEKVLKSLSRLYRLDKKGKKLMELFVDYDYYFAHHELCALAKEGQPYELSEKEFEALKKGRTAPELFMVTHKFATGAKFETFVIAQIQKYNSERDQSKRITSLMSGHLAETQVIQTALAELIADPMYSSDFDRLPATKDFVNKCVNHANEKAIAAVLQCDSINFYGLYPTRFKKSCS
jgi:hypothetical protein